MAHLSHWAVAVAAVAAALLVVLAAGQVHIEVYPDPSLARVCALVHETASETTWRGRVRCWGVNTDGAAGLNATTAAVTLDRNDVATVPKDANIPGSVVALRPVSIGSTASSTTAVDASGYCALTADGSVYCMGHAEGATGVAFFFGDGTASSPGQTSNGATPQQVPLGAPVEMLDCGTGCCARYVSNQSLVCWGIYTLANTNAPVVLYGGVPVQTFSHTHFQTCVMFANSSAAVYCVTTRSGFVDPMRGYNGSDAATTLTTSATYRMDNLALDFSSLTPDTRLAITDTGAVFAVTNGIVRSWGDRPNGQQDENGILTVGTLKTISTSKVRDLRVTSGVAYGDSSLLTPRDWAVCAVLETGNTVGYCWGSNQASMLASEEFEPTSVDAFAYNKTSETLLSLAASPIGGACSVAQPTNGGLQVVRCWGSVPLINGAPSGESLPGGTTPLAAVRLTCGDGILHADDGEECDLRTPPSNNGTLTGCTSDCQRLFAWYCNRNTSVSQCWTKCGDAQLAQDVEACDDNNTRSGDGCDGVCGSVEASWTCTRETPQSITVCTQTCGDGESAVLCADGVECENCDTGDGPKSDGCIDCRVTPGWECTVGTGLANASTCERTVFISADTYVDSAQPDQNNGNATTLLGSLDAGQTMLFRFNLSSLRTVSLQDSGLGANLQLTCTAASADASSPSRVVAHLAYGTGAVTDDQWQDANVTYTDGGQTLVQQVLTVGAFALGKPRLSRYVTESQAIEVVTLSWSVFDQLVAAANVSRNSGLQMTLAVAAPAGQPALECYSLNYLQDSTLAASLLIDRRSNSKKGGGSSSVVGLAVGLAIGLPALLLCCLCCVLLVVAALVAAVLLARRRRQKYGGGGGGALPPSEKKMRALDISDTIQFTDLKLVKVLGAGAGGQVYRGQWLHAGVKTDVAVKRIFSGGEDDELLDLKAEIDMLKSLSHPNILRYYGATMNGDDVLLVTEFMHKGSLDSVMYHDDSGVGTPLAVPLALRYARDSARGLIYLHHQRVIHRDIKPGNLLIDENDTVKLGDFGISRVIDQNKTMTASGTPQYMAPEVMRNERYTEKVDVYSFALVLWEMMSARRPFDGLVLAELIMAVTSGRRPDMPPATPPDLAALIRDCWVNDPNARPTMAAALDRLNAM